MSLSTAFDAQAEFRAAKPIVKIEGVSVRYRSPQEKIDSFKEYAIRWIRRELRYKDFPALQEVDLQVYPGEVLGIIGPNGAGKSTLLKVISRVLKPTQGRVQIRGRVSPLLELGAGFDSELTGRENVYLNSAILGFSKKDIDARFDRIVEFAGLKNFIDAPIRTYSTGMVARLGFSVATDVQPEILIVDEILGVGDVEFQRKSFERIQGFQAAGSTIFLVTHNLEKVREMCSRAIWLDHGKVVLMGTAEEVVGQYLGLTNNREADHLAQARILQANRWGSHKVEITSVRMSTGDGEQSQIFETGELFRIEMDFVAHQPIPSPIFGLAIYHNDGTHITGPNTAQYGLQLPEISGSGTVTYTVPALSLLEGLYYLTVAVVNHNDTEVFDFHSRAYPFRVSKSEAQKERYGLVSFGGKWEFEGQ